MGDTRRADAQSAADAAERDSRAEALLVDGLDHYFAGRYEDAVHLWTRVLFLDRTHARARAYIDRARTALAERQRRADEILHATSALAERGEVDEARQLLTQAVALAGEDERVATLHARLDRLERAGAAHGIVATSGSLSGVRAVPHWRRWLRSLGPLAAAGAVGALVVMAVSSPALQDWLLTRQAPPALVPATPPSNLPVLSRADAALVRARTLYAHGRLAEALQVLDAVPAGSGARSSADTLRGEIQQMLLSTRPSPRGVTSPRTTAGQP